MDILETDVEMVEQNGRQEADTAPLIEDVLKSNSTSSNLSAKSRQTKVKDFAELNGKNKAPVEPIPVEDPKKNC